MNSNTEFDYDQFETEASWAWQAWMTDVRTANDYGEDRSKVKNLMTGMAVSGVLVLLGMAVALFSMVGVVLMMLGLIGVFGCGYLKYQIVMKTESTVGSDTKMAAYKTVYAKLIAKKNDIRLFDMFPEFGNVKDSLRIPAWLMSPSLTTVSERVEYSYFTDEAEIRFNVTIRKPLLLLVGELYQAQSCNDVESRRFLNNEVEALCQWILSYADKHSQDKMVTMNTRARLREIEERASDDEIEDTTQDAGLTIHRLGVILDKVFKS